MAALAVVVATLTGCSGSGDSNASKDRPSTGVFRSPTSEPQAPDTSSPGDDDVIDTDACAEVRSGIEAFNLGDFDETIEHFEKALPLAEGQDDGSAAASDLVEAVRYYAELDAEDYPEAARSSQEFAKYKAITLGQCMSTELEVPEDSPGVEV